MLRLPILAALAFCLLPSYFCLSQDVTIKGKADPTYLSETNTIYAFTYDDYISYKEKELANSTLDPKGNFNLNFSVSQPTYIFLMIDNARADMVVEPGKTYNINFLKKDSDAVNTLSVSVPVEIEFNNSDRNELNALMADFSSRYEAFLEYNRALIAKKDPAIFGRIDTMQTLSKEKYSAYKNAYLNNYIGYTFASLADNITLKEKTKMMKKYIAGKPLQLNNYDYMAFVNQFLSITADHLSSSNGMSNEIDNSQSFSSAMNYIKLKTSFSDTLGEVLLLKTLSQSLRFPAYKTNAVLIVLDQAAKECKSTENRRSAENIKKKLSVMNVGKPAPALSFQDKDGKTVSLADFKGKYVYLNFWASWCSSCTQEMMLIPDLKKQYGGKIIFVSISVDKKIDAMKNFLKKNPKLDADKVGPGWSFLYCDNYKKAKEDFNVLTVPTYYLIDPKGNVMRSPAVNPGEVEPLFNSIKKR